VGRKVDGRQECESSPKAAGEPAPNSSRLAAPLAGLLVVAGGIAYLPTFQNQFVNFDDPQYVVENPHVRQGLSVDGAAWAFTATYASNWHPLTWISHQLDATLFGPDSAAGPHAVNLLLHLASAATLFAFLVRATGRLAPSFAVAALFALHPVNVENVAWIAQRKSVLSGLFFFFTLLLYAGYAHRPTRVAYLVCLGCFALGLLAKPMLVTTPLLLLLLDEWPLGRRAILGWRSCIWEKLPFFGLALASAGTTLWAQRGAVASDSLLPLSTRVATAVVATAEYLRMLVWPIGLAPIYPHPLQLPPAGRLAAAAAALTGISVAVALARKRRYVVVGWLWHLVALTPVLGLIQVGVHERADRYAYLPFVGLYILACWSAADFAARSATRARLASATGVAIAASLATLTFRQTERWRDSVRLFDHAVACTEGNFVAHSHLAAAHQAAGRLELAAQHQEAAYKAGLRDVDALVNLGTLWANLGRIEDAKRILREALARRPDAPSARLALAEIAFVEGRREEGMRQLREVLRIDPGNPRGRELLARFGP
jgi:Tfp pilus assembly protein PilF